jgi:Fe-S cluster assembly protein SufD
VRIAIVNGYPQLSGTAPIEGIEISTLRAMAGVDPEALGAYLNSATDLDARRWALLNTALFVDGLHIKVHSRVTTPLVLVHTTAGAAGTASHPLIIVEAARGSSATIIEQFAATTATSSLCNSATQLHLDADAQIEHYRIFATSSDASHIDTLDVRQAARSRCKQFTIAQGGGFVRTNLEADLDGEHATLDSFALLVGHGARHVDCHNLARHRAPHTQSRQTARAIASGTSRVIFNSKVVVESGANHAESRQSSRGLLLSADAEIDTRPQLEIHTDEVKCAHGATTGRLDPNMLFYMLSRGIDRATAQSLLVYAFLADALSGMSSAQTRADVETGLIAQLPDSQLLQEFR